MRISTAWFQQMGVNAMQNQTNKLSKTQLQLSTGLKNLTPADDPAAATRTLDLNGTIDKTMQYQANIGFGLDRNTIQDSALTNAVNALQSVRTLAVQGLNTGVLLESDKQALAQQAKQALDNLVGIANTQNANGEYIFSGNLSDVPPFKFDTTIVPPLSQPTGYVYQGGVTQRVLQISPDRQVADGDLGFAVFEDIPSVSLAATANQGKQSVFQVLNTFVDALNGKFSPVNASISGARFLQNGIDYSAGGKAFDLSVDGGASATIDIPAGNYTSLNDLVAAVNTSINASSLNQAVVARAAGNKIQFVSATAGSASAVQISNDSNGVLTDFGFDPAGQSGLGADASTSINVDGTPKDVGTTYAKTVNDVLIDIDAAMKKFGEAQARAGARLNALDDQQSLNEKYLVDTKTTLSDTQDLDYADAISRYNLQEVGLQSAQQAYSKIQKLSLFNYL